MGRPIAPRRLELDEDAPVGPEPHAVLGQRGTEKIATELLQTDAIVRGDPDVGVEVEALELGLPRAPGGRVTEIRLVAEAADAGAGAEGDAALDGGADGACAAAAPAGPAPPRSRRAAPGPPLAPPPIMWARAMATPGPPSHSDFSQRLRLHYVDWGNADKPPLVLLHGGRDHCRNWDWVAQSLPSARTPSAAIVSPI